MLISDWSSDVCSSDLPCARRSRRQRYARKPRGVHIPMANTIKARPAEIGHRSSFGHWEGDLLAFRQEFGKANLTSLVGRCSRFRSEEHTSELQSLMRSSYDVFSLEKKRKPTVRHAINTQHNKQLSILK